MNTIELRFELWSRAFPHRTLIEVRPALIGFGTISSLLSGVIWLGPILALLYAAARLGAAISTRLLLLTALSLSVLWVMHRAPGASNNLHGHLPYLLAALGDGLRGAFNYHGAENWHPVTYYWTAAQFVRLAVLTELIGPLTAIQIYTWFLHGIFLLFGLCAAQMIKTPIWRVAAQSVVAFWPSGIMYSAAINSDTMLHAFSAPAIYYLLRWYAGGVGRYIILSAVFLAVALASKSSAYPLVGVWFCIVAGSMTLFEVRPGLMLKDGGGRQAEALPQ